MDHKVIGTVMPVLEIALQSGESIVSEGGQLSWMTHSIEMETAASGKAGAKGVFGAVKRAVAGGTLFMTEYTAQGDAGMVAFATKVPGQILPIHLDGSNQYMVHRGGYLAGQTGVSLEIGFQQKFSAGLFGGAGFILQKVSGSGDAWIELDGEIVTYDLQPGENIRVHPGHVGMFESTVALELDREGRRTSRQRGPVPRQAHRPGQVWLQTMPLPNLAAALRRTCRRATATTRACSASTSAAEPTEYQESCSGAPRGADRRRRHVVVSGGELRGVRRVERKDKAATCSSTWTSRSAPPALRPVACGAAARW
ncbi:MAG: AIM24 family protein [Acidimicrobiia bacterium]